ADNRIGAPQSVQPLLGQERRQRAHVAYFRRGPNLNHHAINPVHPVGQVDRYVLESPCTPTLRTGKIHPSETCSGAPPVSVHKQRIASPGPGKGCRSNNSADKPSCRPITRTSSL